MYNKNVSDCPKLKSENIVSGNIFSKIWKKQVFEKSLNKKNVQVFIEMK
jgi:hypothetical protein